MSEGRNSTTKPCYSCVIMLAALAGVSTKGEGFLMRKTLVTVLVGCLSAGVAMAAPLVSASPLDAPERLTGHVDLRTEGPFVLISVGRVAGIVDRVFKVETAGSLDLPISFATDSSQLLFWKGHLAVIAPRERKAFLFLISEMEPTEALPGDDSARTHLPLMSRLETQLRGYELTRISDVTALVSRSVPEGLREGGEGRWLNLFDHDDYQDPGSGGTGGVGSCGVSCSTTCGDGSNCSATCGSNRCAHCSCPASCTCS
jgi:hypothetical protein